MAEFQLKRRETCAMCGQRHDLQEKLDDWIERAGKLESERRDLIRERDRWEGEATRLKREAAVQWIRVEDRLPEQTGNYCSDTVLTRDEGGYMCVQAWDYSFSIWTGELSNDGADVTHWRPLPEGPKDG